jgi:hypothetical protein
MMSAAPGAIRQSADLASQLLHRIEYTDSIANQFDHLRNRAVGLNGSVRNAEAVLRVAAEFDAPVTTAEYLAHEAFAAGRISESEWRELCAQAGVVPA